MKYDEIWKKVLGNDEKIEYEFSIGSAAIKFEFAVWVIIGLLFIGFAPFVSFLFFIFAVFKVYYLKVANAYAFTNKRVLIHRGWLSTHTISVDYPKIKEEMPVLL